MGYIFFMFSLLALGVGLFMLAKALQRSTDRDDAKSGVAMQWAVVIVLPILLVLLTAFNSYEQVDAGNVKVVYSFGEIVGQIGEGANFIAPWKYARETSIQVQSHKFKALACFSQETQPVWIDCTLNISVSPDSIQQLIRRVGVDYFDKIVVPRVQQNFKDETVLYKSVEIAPNREEIRKSVAARLRLECSSYSITIVDLLLDDINFSDEFERAIEDKQIATQRALEEEQRVSVSQNQALQRAAYAQGVGDSIQIVAEKQAEANRVLNASLTPNLIQYTMVQKLSDKIELIILPAGQNFILSPDMLKR